MTKYTIVLFGEAQKGEYGTAYLCQDLVELEERLGEPPHHSLGLYYAVQALLYERQLIYWRVQEEGFSFEDYLEGLHLLETQQLIPEISALALPGVGDGRIIEASQPLCSRYHSLLILSEADLYDYLTSSRNVP